MTRRRFCMVTTFYPPYNFGGDGIFIHRLVRALAADGHQVDVVHDRDAYELQAGSVGDLPVEPLPGVTVHTLRRDRFQRLELLASHQLGRPVGMHRKIRHLLATQRFDVVHYHNVSLMGGPHVLKYGSAVKLCTMHDYWFVCPMHVLWREDREACTKRTCVSCTLQARRPPQLWRYTGSVREAVKHVDAFIVPSRSAAALQAQNGFPAPIHHIPNFLPESPDSGTPADAAGPVHPRPYFLYVGRLEKLKGVQVLLDVFRKYHAADLLIAGTGVYEPELRRQAQGLTHVHFLGRLDERRLRPAYRDALAVLVPSLCFETFGFVVIEAFSVRTPAIVNAIGALPEIAEGGGGGLVYRNPAELVDAMEHVRTDPELRRAMGQRGYQDYIDRYTSTRHLQKYYALIGEIEAARR